MTISLKDGYTPEVESEIDADGNITARRVYLVTAINEPQEGLELEVLGFSELPSIGDSISANYPTVIVNKKRAEPLVSGDDGDFIEWKVDVDYVTDTSSGGFSPNPIDAAPVVSYGSIQYERTVDKAYSANDIEGEPTKAVQNSVGDPFDPPLTNTVSNQYITIQHNLRNFNPDWIIQFENTTNLASTRIAGVSVEAEQARMLTIKGNSLVDPIYGDYWSVTYEIEVSKEGFIKEVLNSGFNWKDPGEINGVKKLITYADLGETGENAKEFVSDPQRLNEDGTIIKLVTSDSVYLPFKVLFPKDWGTLNIPRDV
jgi:hypothetical protein